VTARCFRVDMQPVRPSQFRFQMRK
jgi:hypothetical protein